MAQIYRFRNAEAYRKKNTAYQPTRPTPIPIGERRKPRPEGRPGYLRIDTVNQGDQDGAKGIYRINTYRLTAKGVDVALLFLFFRKRLCGPPANSRFHHRPHGANQPNSKLEAAYHKADKAIENIVNLLKAA